MTKTEWLRASTRGKTIGVDRENNLIRGYVVAEKGPFLDGRGEFNDNSLSKVVELGNSGKQGLKVRFTHPNSSNDGLGTYLGRAKEFRLDGDLVRADLHFGKTARKTPRHGDLADYVMSLAEEDPDAFSSSLVLQSDKKYRRDEDGDMLRDDNGEPLPPIWIPTKLHASDVVDTGAAVKSFLSTDNAQPAELATEYLDELFSGQDREYCESHLRDFATRYLTNKFGEEEDQVDTEALRAEFQADTDKLSGSIDSLQNSVSELTKLVKDREERDANERSRSAEISSLCELAGYSDLTSEFIDSDKSVEDVRKDLLQRRKEDQKLQSGDGGGGSDDYSAYRTEFLAHRDLHESLGVTMDEYIAQRCEEDGKPAPAKK